MVRIVASSLARALVSLVPGLALVACATLPDDGAGGDADAAVVSELDASMPAPTVLWPQPTAERAGFGRALAASGDTLIVGASQAPARIGAGYVFVRRDGRWQQEAKLASDAGAVAFAEQVAIDGDTIVLTERVPGATAWGPTYTRVRVYTRSGTTWSPTHVLAPDELRVGFGTAIAVKGDTIVVGDAGHEATGRRTDAGVRVYTRAGATWSERAALLPTDAAPSALFAAAIAFDGDRIAVADELAKRSDGELTGNVYVFGRAGDAAWTQESTITPTFGDVIPHPIGFGRDLAIEGSRLVIVVSEFCGSARVYERSLSTWRLATTLDPNHNVCGRQDVRVALAGDKVAIGMTGADNEDASFRIEGAGYLFEKTGAAWSATPVSVRPAGAITAGTDVLIVGNEMLVGAPASGTVFGIVTTVTRP